MPLQPHRDDTLAEATRILLLRAQTVSVPESRELRGRAVLNYVWLADRIARRYSGRGEDDDDLMQVARSGLVEAANRYEAHCATSFPAFAVPTITGVVKRHFRDHGWLVRPPRTIQQTASELNRSAADLAQRLGREPGDHAVAREIGAPVARVREARLAGRAYASVSLDLVPASGRNVGAEDVETEHERAEARLVVASIWPQMDDDERRLLVMRFGEERSQSDIAEEIGTSQMQISRLLSRTLRRLRVLIAEADEAAPTRSGAKTGVHRLTAT